MSLSEVKYQDTSKIIKNSLSTSLRQVWFFHLSELWLIFLKSEISFFRTLLYFVPSSQVFFVLFCFFSFSGQINLFKLSLDICSVSLQFILLIYPHRNSRVYIKICKYMYIYACIYRKNAQIQKHKVHTHTHLKKETRLGKHLYR